MGANSSTLIDDLHTSAQLPDEDAAQRKIDALREVQVVGRDADIALQIVEHGGMQPLLRCYNATHPYVRIEAAKALAVLARQPSNQIEMGQDDVLPQYHPALLTASLEFREHAMALLAQLATPEVNKLKIAHEGLVSPIITSVTAPNEALQLHSLDALAKLCMKREIAELATARNLLPKLLMAARSPEQSVKLAVIRVMTGVAACGENLSAFISSGAVIFLMGCMYCGLEVQLEVARCMQNLLEQIFDGKSAGVTEREAQMLAVRPARTGESRARAVPNPSTLPGIAAKCSGGGRVAGPFARAERAVPSRRPAGDVRDRGLPRSHHRRRQLRRARRKQHDADAHPGADPGSGDPSEEADLV